MQAVIRCITISIFLTTGLIVPTAGAREDAPRALPRAMAAERVFCRQALRGEILTRTELFFGLSRPGGLITDEEFQHFIDTEVTPRFPDGLTVLNGVGQFRDAAGTLLAEGAKVVLLLYPFSRERHRGIEAIRQAYLEAFQQESVPRIDETSCVSF